jgi:hypothetical protein
VTLVPYVKPAHASNFFLNPYAPACRDALQEIPATVNYMNKICLEEPGLRGDGPLKQVYGEWTSNVCGVQLPLCPDCRTAVLHYEHATYIICRNEDRLLPGTRRPVTLRYFRWVVDPAWSKIIEDFRVSGSKQERFWPAATEKACQDARMIIWGSWERDITGERELQAQLVQERLDAQELVNRFYRGLDVPIVFQA